MSSKKTIGIDLGTTNSTVGIVIRGRVEIVQNEHGKRCTPSCVAFKDKEPLIGTTAVDQVDSNMENTIFGIKQFIGRTFEDSMRNDSGGRGFQVVQGDDQLPKFVVQWGSDTKHFSPEEISSLIISRMKEITEAHIGSIHGPASTPIDGAVVAVPACFNSSQRQATKDAAVIAGFTESNVHLLSEPIAVAIAYRYVMPQAKHFRDGKRNLLVFDIGGGKCEASIVTIEGSNCEENERYVLKWTTGDEHFGGNYIDELLALTYVEGSAKNLSDKASHDLRAACRSIKEKLSISYDTKIDVHIDDNDHTLKLTREALDEYCTPYFEEIDKIFHEASKAAKVGGEQIDDYILVGGTTRITKIRSLIKTLLNGKEPVKTINPDEAVAYGAAIYADRLQDNRKIFVESKLSKSILLESPSGFITDVHPQPLKQQSNQSFAPSETEGTRNEHILEEIRIDQLIPVHLRAPCIEITLRTLEDGTQEIFAADKLTDERYTLNSTTFQGCLNKDKIKQKIKDRQFSTKLNQMHKHVCELMSQNNVPERQSKEFETALQNVRDMQGIHKRKEKIDRLHLAYVDIIRIAQENEEFKRRKWNRDMCLAEKNATLPYTREVFFTGDGNKLIFQVGCRTDATDGFLEFTVQIPSTVDTSTTPLKFVFDGDGILYLHIDKQFLRKGVIAQRVGCLQKEEIRKMVDEQLKYRDYIAAKKALETYLYDSSDKVKEWMRSERLTTDHRRLFTAQREAQELVKIASDRLQTISDYSRIAKSLSEKKAVLQKLFVNFATFEAERLRNIVNREH